MPRVFRRLLRPRFLLLVFCIFSFFDFIRILHIHSRIATEYADRERPRAPPKERIYIASTHWNNGAILKSHWNNAVLDLVDVFGADNIFVSVFESGSWDDSKAVLKDLDRQLEEKGVTNRRVEVSDVTHKDEMEKTPGEGWIEKPVGKWNVRRIPYLANLRNKTIKDLIDLHAKGITFDKVLFLNDVVFTTEDVIALLETNRGRYAAACSLDFSKPPMYYDTFALRDTNGEKSVTQSWPYFRSRASRNAMLRHEPVPVASCWNGIVAMPTKPFTSSNLRFRGVPDSLAKHHVEGSECCLIHADNPLSRTEGVYLNPKVRVGYSGAAYTATHGRPWMTVGQIWSGLWKNRLRRWFVFNFDNRVAWSRVKKWMKEDAKNEEKGVECLINEMQVLVTNGWAHI